MSKIIIDVTRLVDRTMQKKIPTGIDRGWVSIYFSLPGIGISACALWKTLGDFREKKILYFFLELYLLPDKDFTWKARFLVGKNYVF